MKMAPLYEVGNSLSRFVAEAGREPVVITENGKPCAALVTLEGVDLEAFALAHSPRFQALQDRAARQAEKSGIPFSEIVAEVEGRSSATRPSSGKTRK